ncbi:MAG: MATE family efflux transporter [Verrucomicrobiota bacterium]|nr:MATE family efflux transporter [Verrucomicrobiota bacterium]
MINEKKTEGNDSNIIRQIYLMSWPNIILALLDTSQGLVDTLMVSKLGVSAISAIGLSRQILFIIMVAALGVTGGVIPIIAQAYGAKKYCRVCNAGKQAILLMFFLGTILGVLCYSLSSPALSYLGATGEIAEQGNIYLKTLAVGTLFLLLNFTFSSLFRGIGEMKIPLVISIIVHTINIVGNYVLIFGVDPWISPMGILGAAVATVGARIIGCFIGFFMWNSFVKKITNCACPSKDFIPDFSIIKQLLHIGAPVYFQALARSSARIVFYRILAMGGPIVLAAGTICFQIRMLLIMPALAMRTAVTTLVGQSIGKNKYRRAEKITFQATFWGVSILTAISIVMFIFSRDIVNLVCIFADSAEKKDVIDIGIVMLRIVLFSQIFATVAIVVSGALVGGGDTRPGMKYTLIGEWLIMLPLAFILVSFKGLHPGMLFIPCFFSALIQMVLCIRRFRKKVWQRKL